jgi:hypothetical protein
MRYGYLRRIDNNAPYYAENSVLWLLEEKQSYQIISEGERP